MPATPLRRRFAVLACLALVALTVPAVTAVGPAVGTTQTAASFGVDAVTDHDGDVVEIPVELPDGGTATVTVRAVNGSDGATLRLRDGNDDGRVTVVLNTYLAGTDRGSGWTAARAADEVLLRPGSGDGSLPAGEYGLAVTAGNATGDPPDDRANLRLRSPPEPSLRALAIREPLAGQADSPAAVRRLGRPLPDLRERPDASGAVPEHALLALELHAPGLAGALAAADGPNASARFRSLVADRGVNLSAVQTNPTPQRQAKQLGVTAPGAARVVANPANDTYYLVVDTGTVPVVYDFDDEDDLDPSFRDGDQYEVRAEFAPGAAANPTADGRTARTEFRVRVREAGVDVDVPTADRIWALPARNQTVTGHASVRPNRSVTVRLTPVDGGEPLTRTATVRAVPEDRTDDRNRYATGFDLRGVPEGAAFEVDVLYDGHSLVGDAPRLVVATPRATVSVGEQNRTGRLVYFRVRASLSRGGFLVLHRGGVDGPAVGQTGFLRPGDGELRLYLDRPVPENATLFAVAHRDPDADRWFNGSVDVPYRSDGEAAADRVVLGETPWNGTSTTATTETTVTTTSQPHSTTRTTTTASTTTRGTRSTAGATDATTEAGPGVTDPADAEDAAVGDGQPGFGVAVATLALVAAALVVVRRRRQ